MVKMVVVQRVCITGRRGLWLANILNPSQNVTHEHHAERGEKRTAPRQSLTFDIFICLELYILIL